MKFSIVVPVYNAERFLTKCIESIIQQNYTDYELILVDDGSTDTSPAICDNYVNKMRNISIYHNVNMGPRRARNYGVYRAKGDYIVTIDSDDCIEENFLFIINNIIEVYEHPSMVAFGFKHIDEDDNIYGEACLHGFDNGVYCENSLEKIKREFLYNKDKKGINLGSFIFSLWSKVVKRDLYLDSIAKVPENVTIGEDLVVTKLLLDSKLCKTVVVDDYTGYLYRNNPTSIINGTYSKAKFMDYEITVKVISALFENEPNKVWVYALHGLIGFLFSIYAYSKNYSQFRSYVRDTYAYETVWSYASNAAIVNRGINDWLKMKAVKQRRVFLFYLYFKYFSHE